MKEFQAVSGSVAGLPSVSAVRIAVTGRQKWKVYLASQAQMAASAMAMFNKANSLAFSPSVLPCAAAMICAILFQWPGGVSVPAPSAQNKAISVCSSVRVEPVVAPSSVTSLESVAYCALSREGGPGGRNWEPLLIPNGATNPHWGNKYGAEAGGVGNQTPGPLPPGGGTMSSEPSLTRAARIWFATNSPHTIPAIFCGPLGIAARIAMCSVSKLDAAAGNKLTSALCAAAVAAALREAPAGAKLCTRE